MLGAGFKPVGELHSQPFDSAFVAERCGRRVACVCVCVCERLRCRVCSMLLSFAVWTGPLDWALLLPSLSPLLAVVGALPRC